MRTPRTGDEHGESTPQKPASAPSSIPRQTSSADVLVPVPPPERSTSSAPSARSSKPADASLAEDSVVGRLLNETLSVPPAQPIPDSSRWRVAQELCEEHLRRIEELESLLRSSGRRVSELEGLLTEDDEADILREELDATRKRSARLEQVVDRLTKERDADRQENRKLADEVARLQSIIDELERPR
jgi:hypothetical protein